ncbi:MAG: hypothetical protein WBF48_10065 [Halarcobacter sp.]
MSEKSLKATITIVKEPILKKPSSFVGNKSFGPKKMIPNKDAYKRQ